MIHLNFDYNVDAYQSIYDPRRTNLKDLNLTSYHQLDKSFLNPIKINKKLELDYNEHTPPRPSLLQKSILDASLNNTIHQPITKQDLAHSKIFETPDATKNEISSYSPVENTILEVTTPDINTTNITQRQRPSGWDQSRHSKKTPSQSKSNKKPKKKKNN